MLRKLRWMEAEVISWSPKGNILYKSGVYKLVSVWGGFKNCHSKHFNQQNISNRLALSDDFHY